METEPTIEYRQESDTFGPIQVPSHKYWGAQTQRSLQNFAIGTEQDKIPLSVVKSLAIIKKCAAKVNHANNTLSQEISESIVQACNEIIEGKFDDNFPLVIFQTGSGTQSNMNLNEVISNRAIEILGGKRGEKGKVHPNDHVNQSQSSNDTFPTAMHISVVLDFNNFLLPSLLSLKENLSKKTNEFSEIVKIGRTHLQDATPLTLGQEFSGYLTQVTNMIDLFHSSLILVKRLAQGGTAVGTGLNSRKGWDVAIAKQISEELNIEFVTNENKFESLATHDALTAFSGCLNTLATSMYKIANDIKILSTELKELIVSDNDVSPCEELLMACIQVLGNCNAVSIGSKNLQII